jgi:DNA-binding MarR family transcriptional regulator
MAVKSLRDLTIELWRGENPGLDTSAMEVVAQVKRVSALVERSVEHIYDDARLTATDVELLVPLRFSEEPVTAIRLAERLGMSRAGVSKALKRLEGRGLIKRTPNPHDRRSALVCMTQPGKALIDDVFPSELREHARLIEGLGDRRRAVVAALQTLAETMEAYMDEPTETT